MLFVNGEKMFFEMISKGCLILYFFYLYYFTKSFSQLKKMR